jgi:hypothetical protein
VVSSDSCPFLPSTARVFYPYQPSSWAGSDNEDILLDARLSSSLHVSRTLLLRCPSLRATFVKSSSRHQTELSVEHLVQEAGGVLFYQSDRGSRHWEDAVVALDV